MNTSNKYFEIIWYIWFGISVAGLGRWFWGIRAGWRAFERAPERENTLAGVDVLMVAGVFLGLNLIQTLAQGGANLANTKHPSAEQNLRFYIMLMGWQMVLAGFILGLAKRRFTGGWRGFGLTRQGLGRTVKLSLRYFFIGGGTTFLVYFLTQKIGEGLGNKIVQQHQSLALLRENPGWLLTTLLIVTAAAGAPWAEELLFRGIVQNYLIRLFTWAALPKNTRYQELTDEMVVKAQETSRWLGIAMAAVFFATTHAYGQHMPALMVLGVFLGYMYERTGNLLLPIVVHSLFNILPVAVALFQSGKGT